MTQLAETYSTQFQLALGDNFYEDGVQDEYDRRFNVRTNNKILLLFLLNFFIIFILFFI